MVPIAPMKTLCGAQLPVPFPKKTMIVLVATPPHEISSPVSTILVLVVGVQMVVVVAAPVKSTDFQIGAHLVSGSTSPGILVFHEPEYIVLALSTKLYVFGG